MSYSYTYIRLLLLCPTDHPVNLLNFAFVPTKSMEVIYVYNSPIIWDEKGIIPYKSRDWFTIKTDKNFILSILVTTPKPKAEHTFK